MAILHKFNGEEVIATELPQLLNQNFDYVNDNRIKTVNNVEYDDNNNIDVTHLVSQSIVSGTDLNNLTTSGEYVRLGSVTKLLNSPSDTPFFLTVLASNGLVKQVLTELIVNNPATFTRTMNGTQWSPWIESGANIGTWESNEQVKVGDVRYVGGRDYTGYVLECVQAGTTGDSQPTISSSDIDNSTDLEGFSGTLQIAHGGTGATTVAGARNALGLGSVATENTVPVSKGGTGAGNVVNARKNLQTNLVTYTTLEQLGLTSEATIIDIMPKIPNNGMFVMFFSNEQAAAFGLPFGGMLTMIRDLGNFQCTLVTKSGKGGFDRMYITNLRSDYTQPSDLVWEQLATKSKLSMPSKNYISIQPSVKHNASSTSDWEYIVPADGWAVWEFTSKINARVGILLSSTVLGITIYATAEKANRLMLPLAKGQTIWFFYGAGDETNLTVDNKHFVYAQSEV